MQRNLVKDWMTPDPISVEPDSTLPDAHELMKKHNIRRLLVMDGSQLVGIVTRGDIRGAEPSEATSLSIFEVNYLLSRFPVKKLMSTDVITVGVGEPVGKAASIMHEHKISGLPVVDDGQVVGIITESDIFRMVVREWESQTA
jgi:CBS domain-containing protein